MNNQSNIETPFLNIAARLIGCREEEILSLRVTAEGGLSVIAPSGRKQAFSREQVEQAAAGALTKLNATRRAAGKRTGS